MTLQPIPSEFLFIWRKFDFRFYQCTLSNCTGSKGSKLSSWDWNINQEKFHQKFKILVILLMIQIQYSYLDLACAGILEQSIGTRNRVVVPARKPVYSLSGRYGKPIPTRFKAPMDCSKIPALTSHTFVIAEHWTYLYIILLLGPGLTYWTYISCLKVGPWIHNFLLLGLGPDSHGPATTVGPWTNLISWLAWDLDSHIPDWPWPWTHIFLIGLGPWLTYFWLAWALDSHIPAWVGPWILWWRPPEWSLPPSAPWWRWWRWSSKAAPSSTLHTSLC